jgi:hypothetical protein
MSILKTVNDFLFEFDYPWVLVAIVLFLALNVFIAHGVVQTNRVIRKLEEKPLQGATEEVSKEDEIAFYRDKNHKMLMFFSINFAAIVFLVFFYIRHKLV